MGWEEFREVLSDRYGSRNHITAEQHFQSFSEFINDLKLYGIYAEFQHDNNSGKTMLHPDTLSAAVFCAVMGSGNVLEIGAYTGGATLPIAKALKDCSGRRFASIEPGVRHDHPTMPTEWSWGELVQNLDNVKSEIGNVLLIRGLSLQPHVIGVVTKYFVSSLIDFVLIDSDGSCGRDLIHYQHLIKAGAYIIIDDYGEGAHFKGDITTTTVDRLVEMGVLEMIAVLDWSTWFGVFRKPIDGELANEILNYQNQVESNEQGWDTAFVSDYEFLLPSNLRDSGLYILDRPKFIFWENPPNPNLHI